MSPILSSPFKASFLWKLPVPPSHLDSSAGIKAGALLPVLLPTSPKLLKLAPCTLFTQQILNEHLLYTSHCSSNEGIVMNKQMTPSPPKTDNYTIQNCSLLDLGQGGWQMGGVQGCGCWLGPGISSQLLPSHHAAGIRLLSCLFFFFPSSVFKHQHSKNLKKQSQAPLEPST